MSSIRIETLVDGDMLYLPQLKPLLGKAVEIVITELPCDPQPRLEENWVSPLAGTVLEYVDPLAPAAPTKDWEAGE
jgi:hypothetical protein